MWTFLLYAIAAFFAILAGFSLILDKEIQTGFVIFCSSVAAFTFWRARKRSKINPEDPVQRPLESFEEQASMEVTLVFDLVNADSGEDHEVAVEINVQGKSLIADFEVVAKDADAEVFSSCYKALLEEGAEGYATTSGILTRIAFDDLGWHDVTASFMKLVVNGHEVLFSDDALEIFGEELGLQLVRNDPDDDERDSHWMYFAF